MNLFDVTTGQFNAASDKPRVATSTEITAYLRWLAGHRGIDASGCTYQADGIYRGQECILAMPGYGEQPRATIDYLDDAGNVLRSMPLAIDAKGKLVMSAKQVAEATGLKPVRKARAARKAVEAAPPISAPAEPAAPESLPVAAPAAPLVASEPDAVLLARVVMMETALRCMGLAPGRALGTVANDNAAPRRVRSEAERRAIVRAWRIRCEARARADLDSRALFAANGAYRGALDTVRSVLDEQNAARARLAEMAAAEAFLIQRGDEMRDARDAAAARAVDMERIALANEEMAAAMERRADDEAARAVAAEQRAAALEMERDGANRAATAAGAALRGEQARAARLVTIASGKRRAATRALQDAARAVDDVKAARAETRAVTRRLEALQGAVAASPAASAVIGRRMADART